MPEPPRPKDAKSVEKPRRGVILTALEFFHISWLLMTTFFYLVAIALMPFYLPVGSYPSGRVHVPSASVQSAKRD